MIGDLRRQTNVDFLIIAVDAVARNIDESGSDRWITRQRPKLIELVIGAWISMSVHDFFPFSDDFVVDVWCRFRRLSVARRSLILDIARKT